METRRLNILFLTDNFPPERNVPAMRTWEHVSRWVKDGHQVTVKDAVVDHRIPLHAQQEIGPGREQPTVDLQVTLDAVSGEDRLTGRHPSHQRQPQGVGFVIARVAPPCRAQGAPSGSPY